MRSQSWLFIYLYPCPFEPPSPSTPIPPLWVITECQAELLCHKSSFPPAIDVTHDRVYMSVSFLNLSHVLLHLLFVPSPFSMSASPFLKGEQAHTLSCQSPDPFLNAQGVALPVVSRPLWERGIREEGVRKDTTLRPLLLRVSELWVIFTLPSSTVSPQVPSPSALTSAGLSDLPVTLPKSSFLRDLSSH